MGDLMRRRKHITETLVYFDGGETYKRCYVRTRAEVDAVKKLAKSKGHVGYLVGSRFFDGGRDRVYCFFKQQPTPEEITRRRANGFLRATWREL